MIAASNRPEKVRLLADWNPNARPGDLPRWIVTADDRIWRITSCSRFRNQIHARAHCGDVWRTFDLTIPGDMQDE